MDTFFDRWGDAAYTTLGFFWMAFWAFGLGYLISSLIQVFVTQERMKRAMGEAGPKEVGLATFFGFISSSCSFAALATTKSLFRKGAGFVPSLAFLLASTNLVIELGVIIAIFLSWQFVVGEYVGGVLLILFSWLFVRLTRPKRLIEAARDHLGKPQAAAEDLPDWQERVRKTDAWRKVGKRYRMEWRMVWKDVTIGFTVAGIAAVFVPPEFYETLFIGTGDGAATYGFFQILEHILIGPLVAFLTFIGSMGNIPLAAVLYDNGVSFAGIMAFIFSDLVVFPVLRINARYYGWRMSFYILATLSFALIGSALLLYYGFDLLGQLPTRGDGPKIVDRTFFQLDYSFYLNAAFLLISAGLGWLSMQKIRDESLRGGSEMADKGWMETVLRVLALVSFLWLGIGMGLRLFG
jgi:uncharacterized membrane protein YraQ (UPF0718 family)